MPTTSTSGDSEPENPPEFAAPTATFFDGTTNRRRVVALDFGESALGILESGATAEAWPYADIRQADSAPAVLRLRSLSALPLARLEITDDGLKAEVAARCATLNPRRRTSRSEAARVVGWSLAAVASILLVTFYGVPLAAERLAPLIPRSFEDRLGGMADNQVRQIFGGRECTAPEGVAAFQKLVERLRVAGNLDMAISARVLDTDVANAFALPGGKIYVFERLLQRADTPDELAGVLAHELGHVNNRDHLRVMIQNGGTAFLVGLLFGDVTGAGAAVFATQTLFNASYSRQAETQADRFAIDVMHNLGRSPKPLGTFLDRLSGRSGGRAGNILASHPITADRREMTNQADRPNTGPELLTPGEWLALKAICR